MKGKASLILLVALGTVAFAATQVVSERKIPKTIIIEKTQAKKEAVEFPHEGHAKQFSCLKCHHKATSKEDAESCFKCHGVDPDAPDPSVATAKENPFHIRCRGCHKDYSVGPSKCGGCHKD